jgi:transposase
VRAAVGRDKATVEEFFDLVGEERCHLAKLVSADAAGRPATVIAARCPNATVSADAFHMAAWATKALDEVRRDI